MVNAEAVQVGDWMATFYNTRHAIAAEVWRYRHCRNKYRYPEKIV